ncbi:hypothetical protein ATW97_08205 [Oenococcus oeni]|nr:hypothetical protein ATW99_08500 [Oenococcus oeni]OIL22804.1 hypothetical protein ATX01_08890 [Oenococcus oeni]OIL34470.1 hypothetical protein ATX10_08505 [Oenococcus oeni]OIL41117.1 hypothetical protein ATX13_08380 [Oenococcus oeni]OIL47481.1 hypothetical protein ATX17_08165 [Oenococcus oeni]
MNSKLLIFLIFSLKFKVESISASMVLIGSRNFFINLLIIVLATDTMIQLMKLEAISIKIPTIKNTSAK